MAIGKIKASRVNTVEANTYVGEDGILFYNYGNGVIRISDGITPGGVPVPYTVASNTVIGGIKAGPGVVISNEGVLLIDSANLSFSFGNFTANNNILTVVNNNENMILQTQGNAEIQLIGNIGFYKPNGIPPTLANRYFYSTSNGQINSKYLDIQSYGETNGLNAPFNVTVDITGNFRPPAVLTGTIAQFTGNSGQRSFIVQDNYGIDSATSQTGGEYAFRTGRGTVDTPSAVQSGDRLGSFVATGWASNGYGGQASGYYRIVANENFTSTARGGRLEMWVVPNGTITETKIVTVDSSGATVVGNVTSGNITSNSNISTGNLAVSGNINTSNITASGSYYGYYTHSIRDAGVIADGGTVTINFATDDIVKCIWANGMTVNYSNLTQGRSVRLLATKSTGTGVDNLSLGTISANQTSTGSTTISGSSDVTYIIEFFSTNTTVAGLYAKM